jgi:uncharacterized protein (TIGR01777 family)
MKRREKVLVTGGTGLIGSYLVPRLMQEGYEVVLLGRKGAPGQQPSLYRWDYQKHFLEDQALVGTNHIIHLAGAGIGDFRWSAGRKKEILESRTHTTRLLYERVKKLGVPLKTFITASGTGYYGSATEAPAATETTPPAADFLGSICQQWEESALKFQQAGIRTVRLRTGIVLSLTGGALPKLASTVKWYLGAPIGSGEQVMPWIHPEDLCYIYLKALNDNTMEGAFNAVAPENVTNRQFTKVLAKVLRKPLFMPPLPGFLLRIALGERASLLLSGRQVLPERILQSGFRFRFPDLEPALIHLLVNDSTAH